MIQYIRRMQAEHEELLSRIKKLAVFVAGNPIYHTLPLRDRWLLRLQLFWMRRYKAVLHRRLIITRNPPNED